MENCLHRAGQQIGNYQLGEPLGSGGFACVYKGMHIHLGIYVAIKLLNDRMTTEEEKSSFHTEARTVAQLKHPHIISIFDYGMNGDTPFLVMDYALHGTLRQRHPRGSTLHIEDVLAYVKQMAAALQYAHDHKIIHRDVKPENMLLSATEAVLLSDFGIAVPAHSENSMRTQNTAGTLPYMAPEQIQGKPCPATDQYALGIITYEWLCGQRPFHGSEVELINQHLNVPPEPLQQKIPTLPSGVEQVILKALEKDPGKRFSSIQIFADALEQASQGKLLATSLFSQVDLEALYQEGVKAQELGDLENAESLWRQVLDHDPSFRNGNLTFQIAKLRQKLHPVRVQRLYEQANNARYAREREQEMTAWQELLKLDPLHVEAISRLRELRRQQAEEQTSLAQEWEQKLAIWQAFLQLEPQDTLALHRIVTLQRQQAEQQANRAPEWEQKLAIWQAFLQLEPGDAIALTYIRELRRWQAAQARLAREREQEMTAWQEFLKLEPQNIEAITRIRELRRQQAEEQANLAPEWEQKLAIWQALLQLEPQDTEAIRRIQELRWQQAEEQAEQARLAGERAQEINVWQEFLTREPQNPEAIRRIQELRRQQAEEQAGQAQELEQKISVWQALLQVKPLDSVVFEHVRALRRQQAKQAGQAGDWKQASNAWRELQRLGIRDTEASRWTLIAEQNQKYTLTYEQVQELLREKKHSSAKKLLRTLWHNAPYYGDPKELGRQVGWDSARQRTISQRALFTRQAYSQVGDRVPVSKIASGALFCLLCGLGSVIGAWTQSWIWALGTIVITFLLSYVLGYRRALSVLSLSMIVLLSSTIACSIAWYTSTLNYNQAETGQFFGEGTLWLGRQLNFGLILGATSSFFVFKALFSEKEDDKGAAWGCLICTFFFVYPAIACLGTSNWGFGFGFGWWMHLGGLLMSFIAGAGLVVSFPVWSNLCQPSRLLLIDHNQFRARYPTSRRILLHRTRIDQAQKERTREPSLPLCRQRLINCLSMLRQCALHSTNLLISLQRQHPPLLALKEPIEGELQQRQCSHLTLYIKQ